MAILPTDIQILFTNYDIITYFLNLASCSEHFIKFNLINDLHCRHPLQELCCSPFVPNDIQSGKDYSNIKVITGPNACGKSVYEKRHY
jgi:DNA mismatch repair ATPase MutS